MFNSTPLAMSPKKQENKALILKERRVFAKNFKLARKEAGLTQDALTKKTGLTQAFLSDVENAKSTVSLDNANVLAKAVGQPLYKLLNPKSTREE